MDDYDTREFSVYDVKTPREMILAPGESLARLLRIQLSYSESNRYVDINHPSLNPLPSREGRLIKLPLPLRERACPELVEGAREDIKQFSKYEKMWKETFGLR